MMAAGVGVPVALPNSMLAGAEADDERAQLEGSPVKV